MILDPFFGSGTTGAVAKKLGRHFIAIERDKTYAKHAERRIAAAVAAPEHEFLITPSKREEPRIPFGIVLERGLLRPGTKLFDHSGKKHHARVIADATLAASMPLTGEVRGSIHKVGALVQGCPPATAGHSGISMWAENWFLSICCVNVSAQKPWGSRVSFTARHKLNVL